MALISFNQRPQAHAHRRMKSGRSYHSHGPRLKSSSGRSYFLPAVPAVLMGFSFTYTLYGLNSRTAVLAVNTALIYCLLGLTLIGVAGQDDTASSATVLGSQQHSVVSSEPINLKILEQVESFVLIPTSESYASMLTSVKKEAASQATRDRNDSNQEEDILNSHSSRVVNVDHLNESRTVSDANHFPSRSRSRELLFQVPEEDDEAVIDVDDETVNSNRSHTLIPIAITKVPNTFPNITSSLSSPVSGEIIKSDANANANSSDAGAVTVSKDKEIAAADRELIKHNNTNEITITKNFTEPEPQSATNEIPDAITPEAPSSSSPPKHTASNRTEWTNDTFGSMMHFYDEYEDSSNNAVLSESVLLQSHTHAHGDNKIKSNEVALIKSVPISASFASSVTKSRRPKRSVVHLYDMVVCSTGCNPLAYKGYGCYCGFLGSGLIVDGIDKCCAKHDWCYHHAKCPPLLTYFVPYYWTCNDGRPKCVNDYRGWKGICGAHLCECDRQFAECLRKYPCPRGRAVCLSSPFRNPATNYQYNYNYIEDPEIHYYYS